jgi:hypothetical protein
VAAVTAEAVDIYKVKISPRYGDVTSLHRFKMQKSHTSSEYAPAKYVDASSLSRSRKHVQIPAVQARDM